MIASEIKSPRVAVAVGSFLGYTNAWIYRQVTGEPSRASLVLCGHREGEREFPFDPVICCPDRPPRLFRKVRGKLWKVFRHAPPRLSRSRRYTYRRALMAHRIELVHAHFGTVGAQYAALCREMGIPLIQTIHGHDITSSWRRWPAYAELMRRLFHECPFFVVISQEMGRRLESLGCPRDRIRVSYLGVPLDEFPFIQRGDRRGPVRFLHAGRLAEKKGVPDLVRAFSKAFPESGTAMLDIVGEGEERAQVEAAIQECQPSNPVTLRGKLSIADLAEARAAADVFVLNCRTDSHGTQEGLPISTLEAACTGLPAISTFHAGIPESIRDGETGVLVVERDHEALVIALRQMLDRNRRLAMGRSARDFMERVFGVRACNAILGQLYREAVASWEIGAHQTR
ncbi:MAG: glycosyltransferase [Kiritimatiellae bacterium]|nr:glycosyltransferase [Kiritimatiellia bacterium]